MKTENIGDIESSQITKKESIVTETSRNQNIFN